MSKLLQTIAALSSGETTAVQRVSAMLQRLEANAHLNAFVTVCGDRALEQARQADAKIAASRKQGKPLRRLEGLVVGVKDNLATSGVRTTACSKILENFVPQYDAAVCEQANAAGAIMIGKTNMDEFGMGSATMNTPFGATVNPLSSKQLRLTAGGSSGGSAAAVAGELCDFSFGSDTGGSVRQPAAFCGVVGLKPTYGLVSRHGLIAYSSSMDTVGVITPTVTDAALVLDTIAGPDTRDSTSVMTRSQPSMARLYPNLVLDKPVTTWAPQLQQRQSLKGLRVGLPRELHPIGLAEPVLDAWQKAAQALSDAGAEVRHVSIPTIPHTLAAYYVIACAEASSNLSRYDGIRFGYRSSQLVGGQNDEASLSALHQLYMATRSEGFGEEVARRIMAGNFVLSESASEEYFDQARKVASQLKAEFAACYETVDVLLAPTAPLLPFPLNDKPAGTKVLVNDIMTVMVNLTGVPAISLPVETIKETYTPAGKQPVTLDLPVSVQVFGKWLGEGAMLQAARAIEERVCYQKPVDN